jgi:hypothetical protein
MKITRRTFIEASALTLAAGLVPSALGQSTKSRQNPVSSLTANDVKIDALIAQMTLEEKIGQMVQAEQSALKDISDIEKYFLGSLLSGGSSDPKTGNGLKDWTDLYDGLQARTKNTRLRIPLLFGIDAVHGHSNVLNAVMFPHNIGLGCTRNARLVEEMSRITAIEVRATGINWTFAPCVTVPRDERWGRTYEGFGEAPELARDLGEAAVRGLQGNDLSNPLSLLACAKHFIGDGGTAFGTGVELKDKVRILDRGDVPRNDAEHHADGAALLEGVAAEPAEPWHAVSEIDLVVGLKAVAVCSRQHFRRDRHHLIVVDAMVRERRFQHSSNAQHWEVADLQVQVGGAPVDRDPQEIVDVHRYQGLSATGAMECSEA